MAVTAEQNRANINRFYEDGWNKGDHSVYEDMVSPDFVDHQAVPGMPEGRVILRVRPQTMLCELSHQGSSSVALQPQRLNVPVDGATSSKGSTSVTLWEPSQNGCALERPQRQYQ